MVAKRVQGMFGRRRLRIRRSDPYTELYERHAQAGGGVGHGDYELIGRLELDALLAVGLTPSSSLLDFGCGDGRLAVHVIPFLRGGGRYVGVDVSTTFLEEASRRVKSLGPLDGVTVTFRQQSTPAFDLPPHSVDVACAFSVFTHLEHEDMHRYLVGLRRVVKPGGTLVVSVLPLDLEVAQQVFLSQAALDLRSRWKAPRNVTTSREMVETIARLAGWTTTQWLPGNEPHIIGPDGQPRRFGQTIAVLRPA